MRFASVEVAIRRGGPLQVLATGSLLLGVLLTLGGARIVFDQPAFLASGLVALVPFLLHRRSARPRHGVAIDASHERLVVGAQTFSVSRIAGAWARDARTAVIVLDDRTEIVLHLATEEAADLLLALGWTETARTLPTPLRGMLGPFTVGFLVFIALCFGSVALADAVTRLRSSIGWLFLVSFALAALVAKVIASPRVVLGADGLRIERGVSRSFVRFADIAGVRRSASGTAIVLDLRSGGAVTLPMVAQDEESITSVEARIEAGRTRTNGGGGLTPVLARGGRSVAEWRSGLAALAQAPRGFRDVAVTPEALAYELENPSASPEIRVAAALALAVVEPDGPRIRVAADTCADEKLRALLGAVREGTLEDQQLEELAPDRRERG